MFQRVRVGRLLYKLIKKVMKKHSALDERDDMAENGLSEDSPLVPMESTDSALMKEVNDLYKEEDTSCLASMSEALKAFQDVPFVFYCKHDDLHLLNKAILYIQSNEQTNKIIIVHS